MTLVIVCYQFPCSAGGAEVRVNGNLFTTGALQEAAVIGLQASLLFAMHYTYK